MSHTNMTGIEHLFDSSRTPYHLPDPTALIDPDIFQAVFGHPLDAGSFGAITQSSPGRVRKILAFSETPVDLPSGIYSDVKIVHLGERNYKLRTDGLSEDFTLSEKDHLHVVGGIIEGVILRSLQNIEGVVSYHDRTFTVVDGHIFMSTEMDEAPGRTTYELAEEGMTLESALKISYDAASTLQQIHSQDIIHGDITPKNIMSDGNKTTITDFGNSRVIGLDLYLGLLYREDNEKSYVVSFANDLPIVGTPDYFAPETFFTGSSVPGDIYSMVTTTLHLTTGVVVAPTIREEGWSPEIYQSTKKAMIESNVPQPVRQAILFNLLTAPEKRNLEVLISALGTSLGAELPAGVRAYSCPSVFAKTQLSYSPHETAKTELLS